MKTDRELLELAAKAAGIDMQHRAMFGGDAEPGYYKYPPGAPPLWTWWNPLTDDGDALRLLVKVSSAGEGLRLMLPELHDPWAVIDDYTSDFKVRECNDDDPYATTRLAIVRAAAAIGESA